MKTVLTILTISLFLSCNSKHEGGSILKVDKFSSEEEMNGIIGIPQTADDEKICFALYTVNNNLLKLTAQFYPLLDEESYDAKLEIMQNGEWVEVDNSFIQYPGLIATFRVENWDDTKQHEYRVNYQNRSFYKGIIKKNPIDKEEIIVFAFTGNSVWRMVNEEYITDDKSDIVENIKRSNPDLLFFSGDQVYHHTRHYAAWLKFGRDFGDVISNTPTICLPDDHDVGMFNLWGSGGKKSNLRSGNDGGYYMPVEYVKEVERAQASHLPDPYDPTPIENGIDVYYTNLTWGGIGFAILEDRKFKTGPEEVLLKHEPRSDHYTNTDYNPEDLDVAGAELLGERQLKFLEEWGGNWENTQMKAVLSQTIFAGGAHIHGKTGGRVLADLDANGWPQTGRNKALKEIRKSYSLMIAGDQHLATVLHHGIDNWNDAGYSFCVPSIANYYLRWWKPLELGKNRQPGEPDYYGEFLDGFNNKVTMHAVANPDDEDAPYNRGEGFGVIKFNKETRDITMECWPRNVDITKTDTKQYEGWPITINQADNYNRETKAYLPKLIINKSNQVVQVINEQANEVIYTLRINGSIFIPKVFEKGIYTVNVGEGKYKQSFIGLNAVQHQLKEITVKLND